MKKLLALILLFFWCNAESQNLHDSVLTDSALRMSVDTIDSLQVAPLPPPPPIDSIKINLQYSRNFDSVRYLNHPFFSFKDPIRYTVTERKRESKEAIFYSIIGLLIFFAVIKNAFRRYFEDLWKVFLRTSMRQKQLKEQLLQSPLPSLLFNIFFFFSGGLFLALMLQHFRLVKYNFWLLTLYSIVGLAAIYATKYLFLKISGWLFQAYEAANTYIFIVFTTNKVIGITILPFIVIIAFTAGVINISAVYISLTLIILLFLYRYFLSYISLRRIMKINFFHFLIYLFAFEILPLSLINKLLFIFLNELM